jgi:hypothetical protein
MSKPFAHNIPLTAVPHLPDLCVVCVAPASDRRAVEWVVFRGVTGPTRLITGIPYCDEHAAMFDAWIAYFDEGRAARDEERAARKAYIDEHGSLPRQRGVLSPTEIVRYFALPVVGLALLGAMLGLLGAFGAVAPDSGPLFGAFIGGIVGFGVGGLLARPIANERRKQHETPRPPLPEPKKGEPTIQWHGHSGGALGLSVVPVTKQKDRFSSREGFQVKTTTVVELTAIQLQFDNLEYGRRFAAMNPRA